MAEYLTTDTDLQSVADAIRTKSGTSEPLEYPDGFVSAIEGISTGSGSSVSVPAKEVNFRDYDGTVVYSYTPAEFAALTAMPDNPDHSGDAIPLTSQGWNWSFADAQAYVAKYGRLEVGQMYATTDGKTHVLIHLEQGRTSPILGCCPNGTVDVDWGDGTAHDTLTGTSVTSVKWTPRHNYAAPGDYDIKLTCSGTMGFFGSGSSNQYSGLLRYATDGDIRNRMYYNAIKMVYCANNVTYIGSNAFRTCRALFDITIPSSVTSIGSNAFDGCYRLANLTIPNNFTSIGSYVFQNCYALTSISVSNGVKNIETYAFNNCYVLAYVIIPESVTNIGSAVLGNCTCLNSAIIPDSIMTIPNAAFQNSYSLASVTISDSVTSIGSNAFGGCNGLGEIHFLPTSPPTVANANAFSGIPTDCKIYVPTGSLSAYTTATNYPSASSYTYIGE